MGVATSSGLVDCVVDGDIQRLKTILLEHDANVKSEEPITTDSTWALELEEAVHTVVASEFDSGQQLQQLQIALELLLQTKPEIWSSTGSSIDTGDNDDGNDTSATSNSAGWSACHRACATGNLAFVAFVLQHYPTQFDLQARDAFGLFPVDLVPPELLMSTEEMDDYLETRRDSIKPATARSRRCLALHQLRERKAVLQDEQIRSLLGKCESTSNQDEDHDGFYLAFEPVREHLAIDRAQNMGRVHERGALLRVNYRLPRSQLFLNGYFQLIWRGIGDARSEEPNFESQITRLRDEHDHALDEEASPAEGSKDETLKESNVVEGFLSLDVTNLPSDSVCHVLFIACDKQMLHRTIALSTEGLAIQVQDLDSDDYSDSTSDDDDHEELDGNKQEVKDPGYTFFVGGEEFSHPNPVFAGQSFPDVPAFENFLRELRLKKQRRLQQQQEQQQELNGQREDNQKEQKEDEQQQEQEAGQEAEEMAAKTEGAATEEDAQPTDEAAKHDATEDKGKGQADE